MCEAEFDRVLTEGRALQRLLPALGLIAVGGTAVALHCRHRVSLDSPASLISRLAESCESEPVDLAAIPLPSYKGLRAPFTDWTFVASVCQRLARRLLKHELDGSLQNLFSNHESES